MKLQLSNFARLTVLVSLILLLTNCSSHRYLEIENTNFTDQIDQLQNLEFTFNKDIAPDSIIELWDSAHYIEFDPKIEGRFKWTSKKQLIFSPSVPFAPNTDYKGTLSSMILKLNHDNSRFKDPTVSFHTPYLEIENTSAYWGLDESFEKKPELRIRLVFNYSVAPDQINQFITISLNKQSKSFRLLTGESASEAELAVEVDPKNKDLSEIILTMEPGMQTIGSNRKNPGTITYNVEIPASDKMEIMDVQASFEEGQGVISVFTSQPVVAQNIDAFVNTDPAVPYETSITGNGFRLKGAFSDNQPYKLTLKSGLKGIFGHSLQNDLVQTITFGSLQPYIAFVDKAGMYLTPGGAGNLGLRIINVPKVKITVFKVFENNIQHYMRHGMDWEWFEEDNQYYDSYGFRLNEDYGQVIKTREYSTNALPRLGNLRLLHLNPADLDVTSEMKGIYLIKAESPDKAWLNDVQLLSYSDIGLIVREGNDQIFVAARSIADGKPLQNVSLTFYSRSNQPVHKIVTGNDGVAIWKDIMKSMPGTKITMITARKDNDFNVLLFNKSAVETTRFDVGGKHTQGLNYDAFIYGDRELYRPGDSVYINTIIRDFSIKTITAFPLKFKVIAPDGKEILKRRVMVNSQGSAEFHFGLPVKALTGTYLCEVLNVNDVLIGNYRIKVEEFMPDRISVNVKTDKKTYFPGDVLNLSLSAMNLSGPPAVGRKVENELQLSRKSFVPKGFEDYNFSLTTMEEPEIMSVINQTTTSSEGTAQQSFQLPAYKGIGLLQGKIFTTVFDETGRPVNRLHLFDLPTQSAFLGITPLPGWTSIGKSLPFNIVALDINGNKITSQAKLDIINVTWETVLERNYGQTSYRSQRRENVVMSKLLDITKGEITESFTPHTSGEYMVKLSLPGSRAWFSESFYAYGWGDSGESSFMVNKDGKIDITFDKEVYEPGQEAKILFKTPFAGELLVTIEQDKVLEYHSLKATENGATLSVRIKPEFLPNIYITSTLLRETTDQSIPLTVAHGFTSLKVEKLSNRLPVNIIAPASIRSNTKQKISVKTSPGAEVTIAVVDEGILQITDYKSPDPYEWFYKKRALEVNAYDLFDELLPELFSKRSSSGGDQAFDLGRRLNPMTAKRIKLLSLWSGRKTANSAGEINFTADIPQFSGSVRIMAVAYKGSSFGSGSKNMRITDPINMISSLPRFLSPGDKAIVNTTLTNTTDKALTTRIKVSAKGGGLKLSDLSDSNITLQPNSETNVTWEVNAGAEIGTSILTFAVSTNKETFSEQTEISIRPAVPLIKEAEAGVINAGKLVTLKPSTSFISGTGKTTLLVTSNPAGQFAEHLEELFNYPYGCLEQTISAAFPQLYFGELASLLKKGNSTGANVSNNINEAIRKIAALQQYNGGVVMWPTGGEVNWWVTVYAAHFLYEAERAGYNVDQKIVSGLKSYLVEKIRQKPVTEHFYKSPGDGQWNKKVQPARETFYSLYVLALTGNHHLPTMNYYKSKTEQLSNDSRYLLAGAYALTGDRKSVANLIPKTWDNQDAEVMTGGSFSSPIRDRALALYTLLTIDPDDSQVAILARQLGNMVNSARFLNTQERSFTMLALGRLAKSSGEGNPVAEINAGNNTYKFTGKDMLISLDGKPVTIKVSGNGNLYWFYESEGIPVSGKVQPEDRSLRVRRQILDRTGKQIGNFQFNQNDLLVVAVSVSTTDNSIIENVILTDLLPACFEIENTRLTADRALEWIKNKSLPEYLDIRDDRVNIFTTATGQTKTFYYLVRVINKGNFIWGPVGAEAMYNGQYYSYNGQAMVEVK